MQRSEQADLAIGAPNHSPGNLSAVGRVHVLYGTPTGLKAANGRSYYGTVPNTCDGDSVLHGAFGYVVSAGKFGPSLSYNNLVIAHPSCGEGVRPGGAVTVYPGSATGLPAAGLRWSQDSNGILDVAEPRDQFGWGLPR